MDITSIACEPARLTRDCNWRPALPSAIILDVGLPDQSGLSVLDRLKHDVRTRHIPVHIISASDYTETALSLGAVGYLLKPVKREQLVDALDDLQQRLTSIMRRVLVVEDDEVQLDSLKTLLGTPEVEVVGVRSASECLEQLRQSTFDCMVMDLSLPDATGFSLLETLSREDRYSFPPVIVYTGRDLSAKRKPFAALLQVHHHQRSMLAGTLARRSHALSSPGCSGTTCRTPRDASQSS